MGVGSRGALALNFSCVCACVCACVSFHAPGLTLRVWRVVTMVHLTNSGPGAGQSRTCSHPAPCRPPSPTASLALRASLCSGMCAFALPACLPPYPSVQVSGLAVSAHAPPSTLASRLSSLALCLPLPSLLGRNQRIYSSVVSFALGDGDFLRHLTELHVHIISAHTQQVHLPEATPLLHQSGSRCVCIPKDGFD